MPFFITFSSHLSTSSIKAGGILVEYIKNITRWLEDMNFMFS